MSSSSPTRRRVALGLYATSTLLSFPHELPGLGAFDLGLFFAWIGPAALVVGLDGLPPARAARNAFFASLGAHALLFHWFIVVTVTYGGMPLALGLLSPLLPAHWVAQFTALFALLWSRLAHRRFAALYGACAWVAVDWVRGWFLSGFPWATLGYALHLDSPLLSFTRYGGVYALSFVAALFGIWLGCLALRRASGATDAVRALAAVAVALAAIHLVGFALTPPEPADRTLVRIAAIQGNIDQGEKWDARRRQQILEVYLRLSEQAAADGVRLIVWPETSIPGSLEWDAELGARIGDLARRHGAVLVAGGMGLEYAPGSEVPSAYYDSAFVVDASGEIRDRYDKTQLVPFGEYVPLRAVLGHFFESLARGLSPSDVTAGPGPRALVVPGGATSQDSFFAGVPICYELIFPDLVRRFAVDGAGVLLGVTNDAWYGRTGAPHQFLAMTALRSAETGLAGVRAANTGISAVIDHRGRVVRRSALFEEAVVVAEVPVARPVAAAGSAWGGADQTFYTRFGDIFAWGCMLVALVAVAGASFASNERPSTSTRGIGDEHER